MDLKTLYVDKDNCIHLEGIVITSYCLLFTYSNSFTAHKAALKVLLEQIYILQWKRLNGHTELTDNFNDLMMSVVDIIFQYVSEDLQDPVYLQCAVFNIGIAELCSQEYFGSFITNKCFICWILGTCVMNSHLLRFSVIMIMLICYYRHI